MQIQFDTCDCCNRETVCEIEPGGVDEHGPWWFTTCLDSEDCEDAQ